MALIDNPSSDSTDPLQLNSLLSFCHRTFKDMPAPNDSDDFDSVHNFLKLKGLNKNEELFDDAKAVLGSELARRPGLGLKRARPSFCLRPDKGPIVSLETTLDIDKLQDPDEFFSAFYRQEFAREEIERQTGGTMTGKNENNPPAKQRRRRPSLFGTKASYKHKYSLAIPEDDGTIASQEISEQDNLNSSNFVSQEHYVASQEGELEQANLRPVSNSENVTGGILDELLSQDIEDLDGDGALKLLQEHLQIKPVDLDKCLHDFSDAGNIDIMDLEEEMPVKRKALLDIQNIVDGSIKENPASRKRLNRNESHSPMYSTLPKSPSAASSLFGEGKSSSKPFHVPFSAADLDLSPAKSPTHEHFNGQSDNLCTMNEPSVHGDFNLQADAEAKNHACATPGSKPVMPGDSCSEKSASIDFTTRTEDSHDGLVDKNEGNHVGEILNETVSSAQPDIGNAELARGSPETDLQAHGLTEFEKTIENILQGDSTQPGADIADSATENLKISQSEIGNKEPFAAEGAFMDGCMSNAESGLEQQNKEHTEISLNDRRKAARPRGSKKRKELSCRQSLAGAGTCWTSGVRRSNRNRTRPLEYWKGERFLRGRVHESLDTVIGIKCIATPSPGQKVPRFKVKSYVSDEHNELVQSLALH
ncbi:hypothetical protein DCAR_0310801 [Daucus carota subsp. sativus]|uniref:Centromere protein C-like n=1 Tax=Daucus carota subsp. sativus TaxID=79200 RepID=A0AAF0WKH5_DAUCS|nr:hypothetical protein DCAR_0310801 [Daucus carota subsp. sativus]